MQTDSALPLTPLLLWLSGALIGALIMWAVQRRMQRDALHAATAQARLEAEATARTELAPLREALVRHETEAALTERHGNVAALLDPIRETLARYDDAFARLTQAQAHTVGALGERLELMTASSETLRLETQRLAQALRAPHVRGQWGELQLQRVCELAGMLAYCDFTPQTTLRQSDVVQRPDLIVRLPGDRQLVVDAKTPLAAYLDAMAAPDDATRATLLVAHAAQVRSHVQRLAAKQYWAQFPASPEFVILFLPGEAFFAAALEADPSLLEVALRERVLLATPITLIALLKAAATGWRQARVSADAAQVIALGQELHQRLMAFESQLGDIGKGLQRAVEAYNRSVGSLDRRVLVSARKLAALQDDTAVLEAPAPIETLVRPVGTPDPTHTASDGAPSTDAADGS